MKSFVITALVAAGVVVATPAMANMALATKSGCTACHAVDKKLVGPGYQDVAKMYAGQKDAEAKLFEKVRKGGAGNWNKITGGVPMPPATIKDDDLKTLIKWILAGAKG